MGRYGERDNVKDAWQLIEIDAIRLTAKVKREEGPGNKPERRGTS